MGQYVGLPSISDGGRAQRGYADKISMRSMASQVCELDSKMPFAGTQRTIFGKMDEFRKTGMPLSILSQLIWMVTVFAELSKVAQFTKALLTVKRGTYTKMVTVNATDHVDDTGSLNGFFVAIRLEQIHPRRAMLLICLVLLPRAVIAVLLGFVGAQFLVLTSDMGDLLLNAIALAFIIDLDDVIFAAFMPVRAQVLMQNLDPLPARGFALNWRFPWASALTKLSTATGVILLIVFSLTMHFFANLTQATDILCSGNVDFVVAESKASGIVHAARTQQDAGITTAEEAVLQLTGQDHRQGSGCRLHISVPRTHRDDDV